MTKPGTDLDANDDFRSYLETLELGPEVHLYHVYGVVSRRTGYQVRQGIAAPYSCVNPWGEEASAVSYLGVENTSNR